MLQDKILMESYNLELTSSEVDLSDDITVIEWKIAELDIKYRQKLDQENSILVTKDMFNASGKMSTYTTGQHMCLVNIVVADHQFNTCTHAEICSTFVCKLF